MHRSLPTALLATGLALAVCPSTCGQGLFGSRSDGNSSTFSFRVPGATLTAVTDAPYSGRTTATNTLTRPDGTKTTNSFARETIWRDSKGRVRTERNQQDSPAFVYIDDPVAGTSVVLNPVDHVAHRVVAKVVPYTGSNPFAGMIAGSIGSCDPMMSERLGTKEISGIKAIGILETIYCPVGSYQGNDKPFAATKETWRSDEYNLTLLAKNVSPQNNNVSITTVEDFKAAEPDPSLFRIPPEYKVVDETATFTITNPVSPGRGGGGPGPESIRVRIEGPNFGAGFGIRATLLAVKDAPYSGREVIEIDQTLANGTHLHQVMDQAPGGGKVWRDSSGRVRTEYTGRGGNSWSVAEVADPAGYGYVIDTWNRIAHRFPLQVTVLQGRVGRPVNFPLDEALYPSTRTRPDGSTTVAEKLGTQTLWGVSVNGYRAATTSTRPMQNETNEIWEYPPYGLAVVTKVSRPGNVLTSTIEDFSPKEPDPALFKVPDGYRVVNETGTFTITIPGPAK